MKFGTYAVCILFCAQLCFGGPSTQPMPQMMTCDMIIMTASGLTSTTKFYISDSGQLRMEGPGGIITIVDGKSGDLLSLNDSGKTATLLKSASTKMATTRPQGNFITAIFDMAKAANKAAEPKQIGAVSARGYVIEHEGITCTAYFDAKTQQPVEIDMHLTAQSADGVYKNFVFNPKWDPALFSMVAPAGYEVQNIETMFSVELSDNVIVVLDAYAKNNDGVFPPSLSDLSDLIKVLSKGLPPSTEPTKLDPKMQKMVGSVGAMQPQLGMLHRGTQWDYLPTAAKLGDHATIVFWYQPKGRPEFKAIYGDLHVAVVEKQQLPPATDLPTPAK